MGTVIGIGLGIPFKSYKEEEEMKYLDTISLSAGSETDVTTTLASSRVIYNIFLEDSDGNVIEDAVTIRSAVDGGVWHVYIYSTDALTDVALKIIY